MKGVFIFSQINDIVFINTDESYRQHLSKLAFESGLIQADEVSGPLEANAVLQLFSPLIASQRFMSVQLHDPYASIRGEGDFLLVFKQFSGFVYLAVNGDKEEDEEFLARKLCVLHRINTFLHGPCTLEIRPDTKHEREVCWKVIGQLLVTWCELYNSQQSFLVEALERLHVNDKVNKTSVELLEASLNGMKASGEKLAVHAMLIAHTKQLALYSSRSAVDLSGGDQLMLILLVNKLFKDTKAKVTHNQSRETIKSSILSRKPVQIGQKQPQPHTQPHPHVNRENSNTPLLDSDQSDSDINSDDYVIGGYSSENRDSAEDARGTRRDTQQSADNRDSQREQLNISDEATMSLDQSEDRRGLSTSLPPLSLVTRPGHHHNTHTQHSNSYGNQNHRTNYNYQNPNATGANNLVVQNAGIYEISEDGHNISSSSRLNHDKAPDVFIDSNNEDIDHSTKTERGFSASRLTQSMSVLQTTSSQPHTAREVHNTAGLISPGAKTETRSDENQHHDREESSDYQSLTVMLQQGGVSCVPHTVHCVMIMEGIYLVLVCEVARVTHAKTITLCLDAITAILSSLDSQQGAVNSVIKSAHDTLETNIKKLGDILKKSKGVPHIERVIVDIGQRWDTAKHTDFLKQLTGPSNKFENRQRLEGALSTLHTKLQELFRLLYLVRRYQSAEQQQGVVSGVRGIQGAVARCLGDYRDYINIMATRNMPMSIYIDEFPGMVHFIFINRSSNVMVAPSFQQNLHSDENHVGQINKIVREKVWCMYTWLRGRLSAGSTSVLAREQDFHYSYFLWYEDNQGGFAVVPPVPVDVAIRQGGLSGEMAGVISQPYYADLQKACFPGQEKKSVCCFELMCVHINLVPTQLALGHARKLKDKLWKVSVDTNSPISLL